MAETSTDSADYRCSSLRQYSLHNGYLVYLLSESDPKALLHDLDVGETDTSMI